MNMPGQGSGWLSRILGGQSYRRVPDEENNQGSSMPGQYPVETPAENNRRILNSKFIGDIGKQCAKIIGLLVFKPLFMVIILLLRTFAKCINTLYFKTHANTTRFTSTSSIGIEDPIDKVNKFIRDLEESLPPSPQYNENTSGPQLPPFFPGSYTQALYMATNRAKFLFVYLSNPQNVDSTFIFNKIVMNQKFIDIFRREDTLIWGGDLTNPEAYQLANSLNVTKFPFLGLMCLTRKTTMSPLGPVKTNSKISLISKIQGAFSEEIDLDAIIEHKFIRKMGHFSEELTLIRNELRDKFISQLLLKQQEANYQKSLQKDRLKRKAKMNQELRQQYLQWKFFLLKDCLKEKHGSDYAKIAVRLNDGKRVTFYCPAENSIEDIFLLVELYMEGYFDVNKTINELSDSEMRNKFKDYAIGFNFKLLSPLPPRKVLNDELNSENVVKFKDLDYIYPNGLLIVQEA